MKRFIFMAITAVALIFSFSGCASIFSGSQQMVVFSAPEGTKFYMNGIKIAEVREGDSSATVWLSRNQRSPHITAKKAGYKDANFILQARVNGAIFVNILLIYPPLIISGATIDLVTGAAAKYPNYVTIEMVPNNTEDALIDSLLQL